MLSKAPRLTLSRACNTLLDHSAAKVGIDETSFGAADGIA